jgi:hypothetical protein
MANQVVRPENRREFMSKLVDPYDPRYLPASEVFSEPTKLGQPEINRANEISLKNDNVREFKVGIQDFDQAIMYYFKEVIKPFVIQNNTRVNVPVLYGDPENWKSVQADGYYRDANGRLLAPLIMFKRKSLTQNRGLGSKIDGNVTKNMQLFQKSFSKRNVYGNFAVLNNRVPETEYIASITPDYVTVEYDCVVWTYFIEQMDALVESINFASRTYWGDPTKFQFYSSIESFDENVTYEVGEDRAVKNTFSITLNGYIIPESINKSLASANKVYGVSQVVFGLETSDGTGSVETVKKRSNNFKPLGATIAQDGFAITINESIDTQVLDVSYTNYLINNTSLIGTYVNTTTATFAKGWAIPPSPLPANSSSNFNIFINGVYIEPIAYSFTNGLTFSSLVVNPAVLGYSLEASDLIIAVGKFES